MKRVTFQNGAIDVAGQLHFPAGFDETKTHATIVLATPASSVNEQIGAIYAERLAARGFLALSFDPPYQGESGGEPRDLDDPSARVEDIRCAVDYLMTQQFVDEKRVGLLGICAGGGYAVNAALTEHRFQALATVVGSDIGRAFRQMQPNSGHLLGLDAFHLVSELLTQPLQVVVAGRRGNTGQYEDGQALFERAPTHDKDFFIVEGAGHYDMYYKPEYVTQAIDRLVPFYSKHLGA